MPETQSKREASFKACVFDFARRKRADVQKIPNSKKARTNVQAFLVTKDLSTGVESFDSGFLLSHALHSGVLGDGVLVTAGLF